MQKANNRFELTDKWLKFNMELANDRTNEEKLHLFKKVGSNFQIKDRTVFFDPSEPWRILAGVGFGGGGTQFGTPHADPIFGGGFNFDFLRCLLDKVRMYFELNPDFVI